MKLQTYMNRNGLRDWQLAFDVGRDRSTINRVRRGVQMPDWPTMIAIARVTQNKVLPNDFLPRSHSK